MKLSSGLFERDRSVVGDLWRVCAKVGYGEFAHFSYRITAVIENWSAAAFLVCDVDLAAEEFAVRADLYFKNFAQCSFAGELEPAVGAKITKLRRSGGFCKFPFHASHFMTNALLRARFRSLWL